MGQGSTEDVVILQDVASGIMPAGAAPTPSKQRGCVLVRTGVGLYTMTIVAAAVAGEVVTVPGNLSGTLTQAEAVYECDTPVPSPPGSCTVGETSDTVKTILVADDTGALADLGFSIVARRLLG